MQLITQFVWGAAAHHGGEGGGESASPPARQAARLPEAGPVNWTRGELIGAGAFGRVYLGLNNDTGQLMAVKQARRRLLRTALRAQRGCPGTGGGPGPPAGSWHSRSVFAADGRPLVRGLPPCSNTDCWKRCPRHWSGHPPTRGLSDLTRGRALAHTAR